MNIFKKSVLALALGTAMMGSSSFAYELNPIVMELKPSGQGTSTSGVIRNTHAEPIAIEIEAFSRKQRSDGTDELIPENQDIIITPPQMVIQPNESQSFRVMWVGNPNPEKELAFRLVTNQLPIRFKEEKRENFVAEVMMKYRYEVALYVQPNGTKPEAQLQYARIVNDGENGRVLEVAISSLGTRRAILENPILELSSGGPAVSLEGDAAGPLVGLNILPGSTRIVKMPAPANLPLGDLSASLRTSYLVIS